MYAKVRRLRYRDGLAISEIARRTSLSRNTIKTWLRESERSQMSYRRPAKAETEIPFVFLLGQEVTTCPEHRAAYDAAKLEAKAEGRTIPAFMFRLDRPLPLAG